MKNGTICFTPHMDTVIQIWINKCIVEGKSGSMSNTFLALRITPILLADVHDMRQPV